MNRFTDLEQSVRRHTKARRPRLPLSEGLFDAGEHVLTGTDRTKEGPLNPNRTFAINGVRFTYGQIIAMADLFEDYNEMLAASRTMLEKLKDLIEKSTRFYRNNLSVPANQRPEHRGFNWGDVAPRYGELALANYAHFAPSDAMIATRARGRRMGNHKMMWRQYHGQALDAVRAGVDSHALDRALVINAFGDHYLTDAFAGGHLFNKQDVAGKFRAAAFDGNELNDDGEEMIEEVAKLAWRIPSVRHKFGPYEIVLDWLPNPNFDTRWVYTKFLKGLAEEKPEVITAGLIAKVIHDDLNNRRIRVKNDLNEQWSVTGDEFLDQSSLPYVLRAVEQSAANVVDVAANPAIGNDQAFAKVWRRVPKPTRASKTIIKNTINKFTRPKNRELWSAAAKVVVGLTDEIIEAAVSQGAIKEH